MENEIYQNTDKEFKFDGHLLIEGENYYSLKTWKELNSYRLDESVENNEKTNDFESNLLKEKVNLNDFKKSVSLNSKRYPYILCFLETDLEDYFKDKLL